MPGVLSETLWHFDRVGHATDRRTQLCPKVFREFLGRGLKGAHRHADGIPGVQDIENTRALCHPSELHGRLGCPRLAVPGDAMPSSDVTALRPPTCHVLMAGRLLELPLRHLSWDAKQRHAYVQLTVGLPCKTDVCATDVQCATCVGMARTKWAQLVGERMICPPCRHTGLRTT